MCIRDSAPASPTTHEVSGHAAALCSIAGLRRTLQHGLGDGGAAAVLRQRPRRQVLLVLPAERLGRVLGHI
eukprot:12715934-Alexandrium_andersonii.AAC.1